MKQVLIEEHEVQELMEYEFIFNQLLLMGQLLEVGDEAQRYSIHIFNIIYQFN